MKMPLSYSRLSTFEQCPAKFDYLYVTKSCKDKGSEATEYGTRVHEVLELHGQGRHDLIKPTEENKRTLKQWGPLVDKLLARNGTKYFEHQMAVNEQLQPVDWFAPDVWIRSIADVLVIDGETAYVIDWKAGKVKDNPTQLQLFAAMVLWHFPEVNTVKTSFVWLKYQDVSKSHYERRFLDALWRAIAPRFHKVHETIELGVFPTKPSGLCTPWCPAHAICPGARPARR